MNHRRGFNRLFFVLLAGWTIYWTVAYPVWRQWEGQDEAFRQHAKDIKTCQNSFTEIPPGQYKECFVRADESWKTATEFYSLKHFYVWDVLFWQSGMLLPILVLPPLVVRIIAGASVWVWQGFKYV